MSVFDQYDDPADTYDNAMDTYDGGAIVAQDQPLAHRRAHNPSSLSTGRRPPSLNTRRGQPWH